MHTQVSEEVCMHTKAYTQNKLSWSLKMLVDNIYALISFRICSAVLICCDGIVEGSFEILIKYLEVPGIESGTICMQSRCSTTEVQFFTHSDNFPFSISAVDNIPRADEIRTLVKDIWDTRIAKLRLSADSFVRQQEAHARLDNLTLMEINTTGAFLTQALDHMYKLRTNLQPGESSQSQDF
uniref:GINS complex subunit 2 n=1 Tax=Podarcis muralis TaxID=64176 RepID=A0A670IYN0_PODMU